ncbi:hypothetical protein HDU96_006894 [Phlyctochytrium bullatum]|nr:hypothetical protein HDU96_006894 [Phlyctochytrium bullatum]
MTRSGGVATITVKPNAARAPLAVTNHTIFAQPHPSQPWLLEGLSTPTECTSVPPIDNGFGGFPVSPMARPCDTEHFAWGLPLPPVPFTPLDSPLYTPPSTIRTAGSNAGPSVPISPSITDSLASPGGRRQEIRRSSVPSSPAKKMKASSPPPELQDPELVKEETLSPTQQKHLLARRALRRKVLGRLQQKDSAAPSPVVPDMPLPSYTKKGCQTPQQPAKRLKATPAKRKSVAQESAAKKAKEESKPAGEPQMERFVDENAVRTRTVDAPYDMQYLEPSNPMFMSMVMSYGSGNIPADAFEYAFGPNFNMAGQERGQGDIPPYLHAVRNQEEGPMGFDGRLPSPSALFNAHGAWPFSPSLGIYAAQEMQIGQHHGEPSAEKAPENQEHALRNGTLHQTLAPQLSLGSLFQIAPYPLVSNFSGSDLLAPTFTKSTSLTVITTGINSQTATQGQVAISPVDSAFSQSPLEKGPDDGQSGMPRFPSLVRRSSADFPRFSPGSLAMKNEAPPPFFTPMWDASGALGAGQSVVVPSGESQSDFSVWLQNWPAEIAMGIPEGSA